MLRTMAKSVLLFYKVAKIGKSGETERTIHFFPVLIFSIFLAALQFGEKYLEHQFFTGFRTNYVEFQSEFPHQKSSLVRWDICESYSARSKKGRCGVKPLLAVHLSQIPVPVRSHFAIGDIHEPTYMSMRCM